MAESADLRGSKRGHPGRLQALAGLARRRYRAIFIATLILVVACAAAASRLRFDPDVFHLLPQDAPEVQKLQQALQRFGSIDHLLVVVRIPQGAVVDPYLEFVDELGSRLEELPQLQGAQYRIGEVEELLAEFVPRSMLFLDEESRREIERRLRPQALAARARELRHLLATPQSIVLEELAVLDPLGLAPVLMRHFEVSAGGLGFDWSSGYLLSHDHRMAVVLAQPVEPPQNLDFDRRLVAAVEREIAASQELWPRIVGDGERAPRVELTGRHVIGLWDDSVIRRDAALNALTALVGVLLLFLFAFRRFGPLLFAVIPLLVGLVLTFGYSALAFGRLSSATSGVAALLIGLAIDFVIVSYGRYVEERRQGTALEPALARMSGSSGRAVVVGGVTSAATFYAFAVTRFAGLRQMGYLTGTGILLCMLAVLVLLPAMLAWREDRHRRRRSAPRLFLHSFGSDRLMGLCVRHRRIVLGIGAALTALAGFGASRLYFEEGLAPMRPKGNPAYELRDEVARRFGGGFDQMMLVVEGETEQEALDLLGRASAGAERLRRQDVIKGWESLARLIPEPRRQRAALAWLEGLRNGEMSAEPIRQRFVQELREAGLRPEGFASGLDLFEQAMAVRQPLTVADLEDSPAGRKLLERFLYHDDATWQGVVYLYPPPRVWRREPPPAAEELERELGPQVSLVGVNVLGEFLRQQVQRDALLAALLGLVLVALLLWLDFRSLKQTVIALVPLGVGIVWMLGTMGLLEIPLNFMNVFVSTMIIGIGVDYGIHMIHRYSESRDDGPEAQLAGMQETGKAIVLAALSTIIGFGSLSLSHYPGLRSMGHVAILGALFTSLVAITLLPAWLCTRHD
ncbi:MAG: efflux RND transporter permease subunit [Thermoanaerobaculia bacterium]